MDNADDKRVMTQPEMIEKILSGSCEYFGVPRNAIKNKVGTRSPLWGKKKYIIVLLYDYTACTLWDIARILGYNSHSNMLYHYKKIKEEISGELYGSEKTQLIYNELLTYLKLRNDDKAKDKREKDVA